MGNLIVKCHNYRTKPVNGVITPETICNKVLGAIDSQLITISRTQNLTFKEVFHCSSCSAFITVIIKNGEVMVQNVEKENLDFTNILKAEVLNYKLKSTGIGKVYHGKINFKPR